MKKLLALVTVFTLSLVLFACGGGSKGVQIDYEALKNIEYDDSKVTINFWHRAGEQNQQMFQKWIKEFNEIYPNITINESKEADDYDQLADKVALTIGAGKNPHIVESYPDHVARYGTAVLELNNLVNNPKIGWSQADQDDFLEGLWNEGQSYDTKGTIKSLPFSKSSEALYYNAKYFEEKGYKVPKTWDEMFILAEKIRAEEGDVKPFGYDSSDNLFITASEQWNAPYTGYNPKTGAGEVLFNNNQSKEMMKYFKDKIDKGYMVTRSLSGAYASDNMKKGLAPYMFVGSTGGARYSVNGVDAKVFDGGDGYKVGVAPVPVKDLNNRKQIQQGPNINLFTKSNAQEMVAAWLFSQFMLLPEKTAEFALQSGYAPVRKSAYETEVWEDYISKVVVKPTTVKEAEDKIIKESIELFRDNEDIFFTSAVFSKSSAARKEAGQLVNAIFAYSGTAADLDKFINKQYQNAYDFITG